MKIIDMHTHLHLNANRKKSEESITERLDCAGIYGACVLSENPKKCGKDFATRLGELLSFTAQCKERLFPIFWIDPYEENVFEKIDKAVESGVMGFKIMCSEFYVYEEKVIEVIRHIAEHNKPVIFHTGILWDDKASAKFNRPANWEPLIKIKGLRFSVGHCSWPWIDECLAVYGKFLYSSNSENKAEMFLDLTPGTPQIYREELLTKIFTIGYDVGKNILFGTDGAAENYRSESAQKWLDTDRKIMDKLGISKVVRENLYYNNLMRFLGVNAEGADCLSSETGNANEGSPYNKNVSAIIKEWYKQLHFSDMYNCEFYRAVDEIKVSDTITIEAYDTCEQDGKRNLLSYLFMCESLKEKYKEKGISEEILYDTLRDIVVWTDIWSEIKGGLYLGETAWLKRHLEMKLFKLGRLQFCMTEAEHDIPKENVFKGDKIIEIHIPIGGRLDNAECKKSIEMAKKFFAEHFPEYDYKCFTCHSWLLDETLEEILDENSNIIKFQKMFKFVERKKSDAILRYVFKWNTTRNNVGGTAAPSGFAEKVKRRVLSGGDFYEALGVLDI